jgi:ABC-type sugar transport system ATPase subunit
VTFLKGEVHALMGENGAGKSTLGKIIAGLYRQDAGTVTIDGQALRPGDLKGAFHAGVRLVHQELAQCPNLTVAENLSLHDMPTRFGLVDRRAMNELAATLVHKLDPGIDVESPLGLLSPGRRQICQIAAALDVRKGAGAAAVPAKVIVFDEPTSSLSIAEANRLLEITRRLASEGITIIYVSHRMGEIFAVCDRITVLRDGKYVATTPVKEIDEPTLVEQMIGRRLQAPVAKGTLKAAAGTAAGNGNANEAAALRQLAGPEHAHGLGPVLLDVSSLSSSRLRNISLSVRAGEVVGIGGLVGCGRSELLNALFGLDPSAKGKVLVEGSPLNLSSPRDAISKLVGYVPEDRRNQGLFFQLGVGENILVPFMARLAMAMGLRRRSTERRVVSERLADFRVKTASPASLPGELSGGNQQKLLIARWMSRETRVLLLDEPTRGIDVGTKAEVYRLVREAAEKGAAVLLVSSEMPELLALSDRILVMCEGRISGELTGEAMTQANILRLATVSSSGPRAAAT